MEIVTTDLSKYGYKELVEAGELLNAYAENGSEFLGDGLTLNFNMNSGYVFLSDEDYNVGVLEGHKVVQFFSCPQCGFEATQEDAKAEEKDFEAHNGYCSQSCEDVDGDERNI